MQKIKLSTVLTLLAMFVLVLPVSAKGHVFPDVIQLPEGFAPEGIVAGRGTTFYVGSLVDGAIYRGDFRTGEGEILVDGETGKISVGLAYDPRSNLLFVAGGPTGLARVFDAETGELVASYQLAPTTPRFINDVIVTRNAAYFTNSNQAVLYVLPLGPGGSLPGSNDFEVLPLSGDWQQVGGFNANGIEATANGKWLIVVHTALGNLYRVDPQTGAATLIDLGGYSVSTGDGLLLRGSHLYVVRNRLNMIVEIDLSNDLTSGVVVDVLTNPAFVVPTTVTEHGGSLYAVNAKFGTPSTGTPYEVVKVPLQ